MKMFVKLSVCALLFVTLLSACSKKSGGGNGNTTQEANIAFNITPEVQNAIAQGSSYAFNVVITSTMPPQGVEIKVDYVKDSGGSVFSQTLTSTNATTPITITNIPLNELGTVTVTVTSKTKSSNTATKTFKLVRK